jgi:hypothetical protein
VERPTWEIAEEPWKAKLNNSRKILQIYGSKDGVTWLFAN